MPKVHDKSGVEGWQVDPRFSQAVLDALPANVAVLNREGDIVAVNRSWRRFADENDSPKSTDIGVNYLDVARLAAGPFSDEAQAAYLGIRSVLDGSVPQFSLEYPCHSPARQRWFQMEVTLMGEIELPTAVVMHHDITLRKLAELDLRARERRYRVLAENSSDGIVLLAANGTILPGTSSGTRMTGFAVDANAGKPILEFIHPDDAEAVLERLKAVLSGEGVGEPFACRYRHMDGSWRSLEAVATNRLADPSVQAVVVNYRDITERKLLEDQLRQSQKMEAIGQLAGGVAHDFNNLLTVMNGYAEIVMTSLPANDAHKGLLAEVVKAGNRAASLTSQLLAFSRKQILAPKVLNLNEVVENSDKMLRRMIGEDVLLVTTYDPSLNRVKVDPGQIEQVVMNLAVNARDAMPQGGTLTIATTNVDVDEDQCQQYPDCKPGKYVVLSMADTGCGMTPEVQARIFEPFYTTKEVGKGTGLGLAMVYGIVKQSEGYIAVDSTVGVGTTFKIFLPSVTEEADSLRPDDGEKLPRRGNETVLLVEDEDGVRKLARLILEMQGYSVLEASNGREAINLEKTHAGPIHLLITDLVMPEMSGRQLVESILPRHQGLKVLYMSGYSDDAIVRHGVKDAADAFLQKPFSLPSLAKKVREVLDGK